MGVNLTLIFDHKLTDVSMTSVMREFQKLDGQFQEVARYWHLGPPLEPWRDAGSFNEGEPFYQAPAGFFFRFGAAALHLHHCCRFRQFIEESSTRMQLRRFARDTCNLLGGDRALYAPSEGIGDKIHDWVTDDRSLADIENNLLPLSPPASSFDELESRFKPPWEKPAYYVDRFEDISNPTKLG